MPEETAAVPATSPSDIIGTPLNKGLIATYSGGQVVEMMVGGVITIFLLFYLTSVCGLEPEVAGLVLFLSLAIDAVLDPLIGAYSDGWKSRWGRRHPFMLVGMIVLPLSVIGLFIVPTGLPADWMFAYVLVFNILMRVSTSLFVLPYAALLAEFSSDYEERARIMIFRLVLACASMATALWLSFEVFFTGEDALSQASPYAPFAFLVAGLIFVAGFISTFGTLSAAKKLHRPPEVHPPMSRLFLEITQLFGNPSFRALFFGILVSLTFMGYAQSLNLHAFGYYWNLEPDQIKLPTTAQPIGMLCSIPLAMWLIKFVEKRTIAFIQIAALMIAFGIPPILVNLGLVSTQGMTPLMFAVASGAVSGMCMGFGFVAFGSMTADATDEHDFLFGVRREGLYFASLVFAGKAALGLGGMFAGVGLKLIGFPSDPDSLEGVALLTPQVADRLGILWGPVFAVGVSLSVPLLLKYKLDRKGHAEIQIAIRNRNAEYRATPN